MEKKKHEAIALMESVFRHCPDGYIYTVLLHKNYKVNDVKKIKYFELKKITLLPNYISILINNFDCYFSPTVCSKDLGCHGRSKDDIKQWPTLWCDIDIYKFDENKQREIWKLINDFPLQPSFIIKSGKGIHVYWNLKEPSRNRDLIKNYLVRLAIYFSGDPGSTEVAHLLRIPQTKNHKYNSPENEVSITGSRPEKEYSLDDFEILPEVEETPNGEERLYHQEVNERLNQIMECEFLKHCDKDRVGLPEPQWYAMVSILAREIGGPNLIHSLSREYPGYSPQETEKKILHAINDTGPATCEWIKKELFDCGRDCKVTSPIQLAHKKGRKSKKDDKKKPLPQEEIKALLDSQNSNKYHEYSAQEYFDNKLGFGSLLWKEDKQIGIVLQSDGNILQAEPKRHFVFSRSRLTSNCIKRFQNGGLPCDPNLVDHLSKFFSEYVFFKDKRYSLLLSVWSMGTHLFKLFNYYGYLWINSPTIRCGKSLLLDLLDVVCFNSPGIQVCSSEALIFREVHANAITLILDEVENLLSDRGKENYPDLISLLDAGFKAKGVVGRIEGKGEYKTKYYRTFSPKVIACVNPIATKLADRSFLIKMTRKTKDESIERFNERLKGDEFERIREEQYLWALENADEVREAYDGIKSGIPEITEIDDRAKDIWEPILSVASVWDAQEGNDFKVYDSLVELALDMGRGRMEKEESDSLIRPFIEIVKKFIPEKGTETLITSQKLFNRVKDEEVFNSANIDSPADLANFLKRFGIAPHSHWIADEAKTMRAYRINPERGVRAAAPRARHRSEARRRHQESLGGPAGAARNPYLPPDLRRHHLASA